MTMKYITLGSACCVTYQLNKYNLRDEAYPFDWAKINLTQLITILENNFLNYDTIIIKKLSDNHNGLLLKNDYNVQFAHEVKSEYELDEFNNKMKNRINRFNSINEKVTFIRIELTPIKLNFIENINKLCLLLNKYSNNCILKLIINSDIIFDDLPSNIKIYKFTDYSFEWKMDHIDWYTIFFN